MILPSAVNGEYNIVAERSGAISLRAKQVISLRRSRNITKKRTDMQEFESIRKTAENIFFIAHRQRVFIGAFTAFTAASKVRRVKALFILFENSLEGFRPQGVFYSRLSLTKTIHRDTMYNAKGGMAWIFN